MQLYSSADFDVGGGMHLSSIFHVARKISVVAIWH